MQHYLDVNGDSGVEFYEIGPDYIDVKFKRGSVYRYSYEIAGKHHVENMKALAKSGDGLNSYIMRNVRKLYDK